MLHKICIRSYPSHSTLNSIQLIFLLLSLLLLPHTMHNTRAPFLSQIIPEAQMTKDTSMHS